MSDVMLLAQPDVITVCIVTEERQTNGPDKGSRQILSYLECDLWKNRHCKSVGKEGTML